jgi:hypothetical protein
MADAKKPTSKQTAASRSTAAKSVRSAASKVRSKTTIDFARSVRRK